jgi:hypothetical protein
MICATFAGRISSAKRRRERCTSGASRRKWSGAAWRRTGNANGVGLSKTRGEKMPLPDPADLAWMEDIRRERARRLWLAENRGQIEDLIAKLREAHRLSRTIWASDSDEVPAAILNAIETAEQELET